jgi:hypothetical protein
MPLLPALYLFASPPLHYPQAIGRMAPTPTAAFRMTLRHTLSNQTPLKDDDVNEIAVSNSKMKASGPCEETKKLKKKKKKRGRKFKNSTEILFRQL